MYYCNSKAVFVDNVGTLTFVNKMMLVACSALAVLPLTFCALGNCLCRLCHEPPLQNLHLLSQIRHRVTALAWLTSLEIVTKAVFSLLQFHRDPELCFLSELLPVLDPCSSSHVAVLSQMYSPCATTFFICGFSSASFF